MAEFQKVMRQAARLCNYMDNKCTCCPLTTEAFCQSCANEMENFPGVEKAIMSWAAEHPEPVYPSVAKYLEQFGIIIRRDGTLQADFFKAHKPMSAEMTKLLGISSGEGENEKTD